MSESMHYAKKPSSTFSVHFLTPGQAFSSRQHPADHTANADLLAAHKSGEDRVPLVRAPSAQSCSLRPPQYMGFRKEDIWQVLLITWIDPFVTVSFVHWPPCSRTKLAILPQLSIPFHRHRCYASTSITDSRWAWKTSLKTFGEENPTFCDITANYCPWQGSLSTVYWCAIWFSISWGETVISGTSRWKQNSLPRITAMTNYFCRNQKKIFSNVFFWHVLSFLFSNVILCGSHQSLQREQKVHW